MAARRAGGRRRPASRRRRASGTGSGRGWTWRRSVRRHRRPQGAPWWASLALWRGLAFAGFALAFALGVTMLAPRTERPQEMIVAVLAGADAKPVLVASADRGGRYLTVKALAPVSVAADRALELWALPEGKAAAVAGSDPRVGHRARCARRTGGNRVPERSGARREPRTGRRLADGQADRARPLLGRRATALLTASRAETTPPHSVFRLRRARKREGPDANVRPFRGRPSWVRREPLRDVSRATRCGRRLVDGHCHSTIVLAAAGARRVCAGTARAARAGCRVVNALRVVSGALLCSRYRTTSTTAGLIATSVTCALGFASARSHRTLRAPDSRARRRRQTDRQRGQGDGGNPESEAEGRGFGAIRVHGDAPGSVFLWFGRWMRQVAIPDSGSLRRPPFVFVRLDRRQAR